MGMSHHVNIFRSPVMIAPCIHALRAFRSHQFQRLEAGLDFIVFSHDRGRVAGPAGPAKARPHFSGSLVSFSDCRDSLRTRRLCQVSYASLPLAALPCVYAFLVYNRSRSFAGGSGARRGPTGLHRHPRISIPQVVFTAAHCLL